MAFSTFASLILMGIKISRSRRMPIIHFLNLPYSRFLLALPCSIIDLWHISWEARLHKLCGTYSLLPFPNGICWRCFTRQILLVVTAFHQVTTVTVIIPEKSSIADGTRTHHLPLHEHAIHYAKGTNQGTISQLSIRAPSPDD